MRANRKRLMAQLRAYADVTVAIRGCSVVKGHRVGRVFMMALNKAQRRRLPHLRGV